VAAACARPAGCLWLLPERHASWEAAAAVA
jgi:hypothetical protein